MTFDELISALQKRFPLAFGQDVAELRETIKHHQADVQTDAAYVASLFEMRAGLGSGSVICSRSAVVP